MRRAVLGDADVDGGDFTRIDPFTEATAGAD